MMKIKTINTLDMKQVMCYHHLKMKEDDLVNYDRVIVELLGRVAVLEDEVAKLKEANDVEPPNLQGANTIGTLRNFQTSTGRDTTRYLFRNRAYGKRQLVLAVVQEYAKEHPEISASELRLTFDKNIQGSLGVVRELEELKNSYPHYHRRFFAAPNEVIRTTTGDCVVCGEWGIGNINGFIQRANQLGFEIEAV